MMCNLTSAVFCRCCRSVHSALNALVWSRAAKVQQIVADLEIDAVDEVAAMVSAVATLYAINEDGTVSSRGKVRWRPPDPSMQLTRVYSNNNFAAPSAAALAISNFDGYMTLSQPFTAEVPQSIASLCMSDLNGTTAQAVRAYMRTILLPTWQHISRTMETHSAIMCVVQLFIASRPIRDALSWRARVCSQ
eukprot:SAG31_NODE_699_length_12741_cov_5.762617_3_plen_191_part_00